MLNIRELVIDACVADLQQTFTRTYGDRTARYRELLDSTARHALRQIAGADALYHNVDHTVLVTLAGQSLLEGKRALEQHVPPQEWLHMTLALLFHDIGFVRGLCEADRGERVATGVDGGTVVWPDGRSAAILTPYHVDRSKLYLQERFGAGGLLDLDLEMICDCIERTRFPVPDASPYDRTGDLPGLTRAADFIGQLADPEYLRKIPALFYEFEELGLNGRFGYRSPQQMRDKYAAFFSGTVTRYIGDAERYLRVTATGRRWLQQLYANVTLAQQPRG